MVSKVKSKPKPPLPNGPREWLARAVDHSHLEDKLNALEASGWRVYLVIQAAHHLDPFWVLAYRQKP